MTQIYNDADDTNGEVQLDIDEKNEDSLTEKIERKDLKLQTKLEQFFAKNREKAEELGVIDPRRKPAFQPYQESLLQ